MILDATIGRESETATLLRNTMQGRHSLLIGRNGIGKTHLLLDLQRKLKKHVPNRVEGIDVPTTHGNLSAVPGTTQAGAEPQENTVIHYIRRPVPAKETIDIIYTWLSMTGGISKPRKVMQGTRIVELGAMIAEVLALPQMSGRKLVLLLDEFDQLPVLAVPVIEILTERVTIVAAARRRNMHPRFNRLLWRFDEILIKQLSPRHSRELAAHVLQGVPGVRAMRAGSVGDNSTYDFLLNQVANLSNGVPSAIAESVDRLRGAERIDKQFVRELFVHRSSNIHFDAAPLILSFFAFLIVMRYINRGMYQFDMYAIFGALSGMMLLARWFMMRTSRSNS